MADLPKTHIAPAGWREGDGRARCGRPFATLPSSCGCGSPACTSTIESDGRMADSATQGDPAPDGICVSCWRDLGRKVPADV